MTQQIPATGHPDEDQMFKSQMEQMVDTYDAHMKRATFGREQALRQTTVELAGVKPGDYVLEVGCGTGTLTLAAKRQAGPTGKAFGIDVADRLRATGRLWSLVELHWHFSSLHHRGSGDRADLCFGASVCPLSPRGLR